MNATDIEFSARPVDAGHAERTRDRFDWFGVRAPHTSALNGPAPEHVHWRFLRFNDPRDPRLLGRILRGLRNT